MAKVATDTWRGRVGGICPRCSHEPLAEIEAALPAHLPICTKCGWRDPHITRYVVFIRRPHEDDDAEAEAAIVVTDTPSSAVMRCVRKGWVRGADRVRVEAITPAAMIPPTYLDRVLTAEQLIALGDANATTPDPDTGDEDPGQGDRPGDPADADGPTDGARPGDIPGDRP